MKITFNKTDWQYIDNWSKKIRAINHLGGKCKKCGNDNIFHLTFHHKNQLEKEFNISDIKEHRWSTILKEIEKCELLCSNCHQEHHHMFDNVYDERFRKNKQIYLEYKGDKCERCGYYKCDASLSFHHKDEENKSFMLSRVKKGIKNINELKTYITEELDKCEVICNNCHNEEHIDKEKYERLKDQIYYKVNNFKEKQSKINTDEVYEMFDSGMKKVEISRHFNAAKSTITGIIKNRKVG